MLRMSKYYYSEKILDVHHFSYNFRLNQKGTIFSYDQKTWVTPSPFPWQNAFITIAKFNLVKRTVCC